MSDLSHTTVYAAVAGAVKNALDAHPDWMVPQEFARSVAKRAAGTLAGMHPEAALAASRRSEKRARATKARATGITSDPRPGARRCNNGALRAALAVLQEMAIAAHNEGKTASLLAICTAARHVKIVLKMSDGRNA